MNIQIVLYWLKIDLKLVCFSWSKICISYDLMKNQMPSVWRLCAKGLHRMFSGVAESNRVRHYIFCVHGFLLLHKYCHVRRIFQLILFSRSTSHWPIVWQIVFSNFFKSCHRRKLLYKSLLFLCVIECTENGNKRNLFTKVWCWTSWNNMLFSNSRSIT